MPRRSEGARLQLKAARRDKSGKITHQATWIIRDNGRDVGTGCAAEKRIERLNAWWGAKMLGEVNGEACRAYSKKRRNRGGARRDLEDLRAAIGHHAAEGYHREIVKVRLPEKGEPRDKWLTRSDAAKLIWACWRYREMQKRSRRPTDDVKAPTAKRPLRHLARFILL